MIEKVKLLIVDDHSVVRQGLKFILQNQDEYEFEITEASSRLACLKALDNNHFDIILLDIKIGTDDGIALTREILIGNADLNIIALTMHEDEYIIKQMMNAGANGYLLKNTGGEELLWAIKSVLSGEIYYSNKVAITLLQEDKPSPKNKTSTLKESLTAREKEILKYIVAEHTNEEIAKELSLSKRTIDGHRQNLIEKLGVRNTAGLVKFAIKAKID